MFTGIVEETGEVIALDRSSHGARLIVKADVVASDVKLGDSIAVNGCCLTVTAQKGGELSFDLLSETLVRTNLGDLIPGCKTRLLPALTRSR